MYSNDTTPEEIELINKDVRKEFSAKLSQLLEDYHASIVVDNNDFIGFKLGYIGNDNGMKQFKQEWPVCRDEITHWDLA